jgi:hypothetical protein
LERGGFHELLRAVDTGTLSVYAASVAAGFVRRPEPLGTGSPNARKRIDWAIHRAYREGERAGVAPEPVPEPVPVQEAPRNGRSASSTPIDLAAALAEVEEMRRPPAPVTTVTETITGTVTGTVTKPATQKPKKAKPVVTRPDPRALIA